MVALDVAPCEGALSETSVLNLPTEAARAIISDGWRSCGEVWTSTALSHDSRRGFLYCRQSKAVSVGSAASAPDICQHNLSCLWSLLCSGCSPFLTDPSDTAGFPCLLWLLSLWLTSVASAARRFLADEGFLQRSTVLCSSGGFAVSFCSSAQGKMLLNTFPFFWLKFLNSGLQLYLIIYRCKTSSLSL